MFNDLNITPRTAQGEHLGSENPHIVIKESVEFRIGSTGFRSQRKMTKVYGRCNCC